MLRRTSIHQHNRMQTHKIVTGFTEPELYIYKGNLVMSTESMSYHNFLINPYLGWFMRYKRDQKHINWLQIISWIIAGGSKRLCKESCIHQKWVLGSTKCDR